MSRFTDLKQPSRWWQLGLGAGLAAAMAFPTTTWAEDTPVPVDTISADDFDDDLMDLDLEDLANVEVTSVTKTKGRKLSQSPAAITLITSEDIRRSGHQSLPELLRGVPGLHVGRINESQWAISSRGFNGRFNNKMLVLMDGRSLYTPLFSGVYWDQQDTLMDDLERVEVIRGPGGTLWGANAVNGVINFTTKSAKDTQGWLFSGGLGDGDLESYGAMRYGGEIGNGHFRVYGKFNQYDPSDIMSAAGVNDYDDWRKGQGGFRADWENEGDTLTVQGDVFDARVGSITSFGLGTDELVSGGNVLARWSRELEDDGNMQLQFYWDMYNRKGFTLEEERHTFDLDFQHAFKPREGHNLIWGANFHLTMDDIESPAVIPNGFGGFIPAITFGDDQQENDTVSAFIQNSFFLIPDALELSIGSKVEYNDFTGAEFQPSAKLTYMHSDDHTLWGSLSRAVRTPSRVEDDATFAAFGLVPNDDLDPEEIIAVEGGYRFTPGREFSFDIASYFNKYRKLVGTGGGTFDNDFDGEAIGVEVASTYNPADNLRFKGTYTFHRYFNHPGASNEGSFPRNMASLAAYYDVTDDLEINAATYYNDSVASVGVDSYIRVDCGVTWRPNATTELSIIGQNLTDGSHAEYADPTFGGGGEIRRSVFGKATLKF